MARMQVDSFKGTPNRLILTGPRTPNAELLVVVLAYGDRSKSVCYTPPENEARIAIIYREAPELLRHWAFLGRHPMNTVAYVTTSTEIVLKCEEALRKPRNSSSATAQIAMLARSFEAVTGQLAALWDEAASTKERLGATRVRLFRGHRSMDKGDISTDKSDTCAPDSDGKRE